MRAVFALALLAGLAALLATAGAGRSRCAPTFRTGWTGYAPLATAPPSRPLVFCPVVPSTP